MLFWILFALLELQIVHGISCYSCTFNFNDIYDIQDGKLV